MRSPSAGRPRASPGSTWSPPPSATCSAAPAFGAPGTSRRDRCRRGPSRGSSPAGGTGRSHPGQGPGGRANTCPFVEKGSTSIRWDGAISPCLPLLHTQRSYLDFRPRTSHAYAVANVNETSLAAAWSDPAYVELRERLLAFEFAPCTICNSCDMADKNHEDRFGSPAPACGGCLWAQGFIQCP